MDDLKSLKTNSFVHFTKSRSKIFPELDDKSKSLKKDASNNDFNLMEKIIQTNEKIAKILKDENEDGFIALEQAKTNNDQKTIRSGYLQIYDTRQICGQLMEVICYKLKQATPNHGIINNVTNIEKNNGQETTGLNNFSNVYLNSWNRPSYFINFFNLDYHSIKWPQHFYFNQIIKPDHIPMELFVPKSSVVMIAECYRHTHLLLNDSKDLWTQMINMLRFYLVFLQDFFMLLFNFKFLLPSIVDEYFRCSFPMTYMNLNSIFIEVDVKCKISSNKEKFIHATAYVDNILAIDCRISYEISFLYDSVYFKSNCQGIVNMFDPCRSFDFTLPDFYVSNISSKPQVSSIGTCFIKETQSNAQFLIDWSLKTSRLEDLLFNSILV